MVEGVLQHRRLPRRRRSACCGPTSRRPPARCAGRSSFIILAASVAMRPYSSRGLRLHLPRAVHLVAQAPELHVVRLLPAMRAAQVRPGGAAGVVAVLEQVARRVAVARAQVHRQHRLDVGQPAPVDELVGAEGVGLGRHPGQVEPARPLLHRADAVFPVVAADEVAAGVTHDGRRQFAHQREHVVAEAVACRPSCGRARRCRRRRSGPRCSTKAPNSRGSVSPITAS